MPTRRQVLGCPVDAVTLSQAVDRVERWVGIGEQRRGCAINANKLVQLSNDSTLRDEIFAADLILPDGSAVLWAAQWEGTRLPARVTGVELMEALLDRAATLGWRPFLLGATPEVLERAVRALKDRHPALGLAGHHHGFFDDAETMAHHIASTSPDLLFVAMGTPSQEHFLHRWGSVCNAKFAMGVGGSVDVLAGAQPRAPRWLQDHSLEWAWRVGREPRKRWRRLLDPVRVLSRALRNRGTS